MNCSEHPSRREFLGAIGTMVAGATSFAASELTPDLTIASGENPKAMTKKAIAELGGMKRFVSRGDVVVVKPNIAWVRTPEQACNTNPDVVAALVEMALDAGAKEVKVFDRTDRPPKDCYERSGIAEAARKAGAKVFLQDELEFVKVPLKSGDYLKEATIAKAALECDCYINVPIAKHHNSTILTMAMKNHLGIVSADETHKVWHPNLNQAICDFALFFKPKLNVLDAYRILVRRGPAGGNLADVETPKKIIAGVDQAAVDSYGTTLFPMWAKKPTDILQVAIAGKMGIGEIDLAKLRMREVSV